MEIENKCCDYEFNKPLCDLNHDDFIDREIKNAIQKIAKKEGFISYNVRNVIFSTDGANYLGVLHAVDIIGKTKDGDRETNIFIKSKIQENENFKVVSISDAYHKELYAYKELRAIINNIEQEAGVPDGKRFKMTKSYNESNTNMIILENMAKKGFETFHRMDVITLKFAELAVKELAKFHGIFYVIQNKRKEYFDRKLRPMKQPFNYTGNWTEFIINLFEKLSEPLEIDIKEKIVKFIPVFLKKFPEYMQDRESIGCTICHGDYRANNILMKLENGEPCEVIPVDYQLLYYGCPLNDFFFLVFTGTDQQFRKSHLVNLKNLYYHNLENYLKFFDMDIEMIYPRKEFERQYKERLDFGLMMTLFSTPFCFSCDDSVPDVGKDDIANMKYKLDKRYEERVRGAVNDYTEWGYLN